MRPGADRRRPGGARCPRPARPARSRASAPTADCARRDGARARRRRSRRPTATRSPRRPPARRACRSAPGGTSRACRGPSSSSRPGTRTPRGPPRSRAGKISRSIEIDRSAVQSPQHRRVEQVGAGVHVARGSRPRASRGTPRRARRRRSATSPNARASSHVVQRDRDARPRARGGTRASRVRSRSVRMSPFSAKNGSSPSAVERVDDRAARAERLILGDPGDRRGRRGAPAMNGWKVRSRYGEDSTTSCTPWRARWSSTWSSPGRSTTGISGFGVGLGQRAACACPRRLPVRLPSSVRHPSHEPGDLGACAEHRPRHRQGYATPAACARCRA